MKIKVWIVGDDYGDGSYGSRIVPSKIQFLKDLRDRWNIDEELSDDDILENCWDYGFMSLKCHVIDTDEFDEVCPI